MLKHDGTDTIRNSEKVPSRRYAYAAADQSSRIADLGEWLLLGLSTWGFTMTGRFPLYDSLE